MTGRQNDNPKPRRDDSLESGLDRERLASDLRALLHGAEKGAGASPDLRETIQRRAAMVLRARRRQRRQRIAGGVAAACLLVLVGGVFLFEGGHEPLTLSERAASPRDAAAIEASRLALLPGDLDGNGRIDVRDARRLALSIQTGTAEIDHDIDGNGRVELKDVDLLMKQAVRLEGR